METPSRLGRIVVVPLLALSAAGAAGGATLLAGEPTDRVPDPAASVGRVVLEYSAGSAMAAGRRGRVYPDRVGELAPGRSVPDIAAITVAETNTDIRFTVRLATRFEIADGLDILVDLDRDRRTGMPAVEGVPWARGAELSFRLDRSLGAGATNSWVCDWYAAGLKPPRGSIGSGYRPVPPSRLRVRFSARSVAMTLRRSVLLRPPALVARPKADGTIRFSVHTRTHLERSQDASPDRGRHVYDVRGG